MVKYPERNSNDVAATAYKMTWLKLNKISPSPRQVSLFFSNKRYD